MASIALLLNGIVGEYFENICQDGLNSDDFCEAWSGICYLRLLLDNWVEAFSVQ